MVALSGVESSTPPNPLPPSGRWIIVLFDGTWADRKSKEQTTVIEQFSGLFAKNPNFIIKYYSGVGSSSSLKEKYIGGVAGAGIEDAIIDAFQYLLDNYHEGYKLAILGYSRGAYAARSLAAFISRIGFPQRQGGNNGRVSRHLYERYLAKDLTRVETCLALQRQYSCLCDIPIDALCCFDTVGSFGIPKTGLLGIAKWTPKCSKKHQFHETAPAKNVRNFFHALALHEDREAFTPTLTHIPQSSTLNLEQVWFIGDHYDLGKGDPVEGGLLNIPLAWMVSKLKGIGVNFDDEALKARFPRYLNPRPSESIEDLDWVNDEIHPTKSWIWKLMGRRKRIPGSYVEKDPRTNENMKTNERIHISVRTRNYGITRSDPAIPTHTYRTSPEGGSWNKTGSWSTKGSRRPGAENVAPAILEAEIMPFEAELLGLPGVQ